MGRLRREGRAQLPQGRRGRAGPRARGPRVARGAAAHRRRAHRRERRGEPAGARGRGEKGPRLGARHGHRRHLLSHRRGGPHSQRRSSTGRRSPPLDRVRLEALHAIGRGLAVVDPVSALYVKARNLVDALRARSRVHVVRAAAAEAWSLAAARRAPRASASARYWTWRGALSENGRDPAGYALYQITYGICQYLRGQWKEAFRLLDECCARLAAVRRWQANANVFAVYALTYRGDLREVKLRTTRLLADAERRGDLYTMVNLRASHPIAAWLGADDVETARRHIRESMAQWSKTRFLVQHWQCVHLGGRDRPLRGRGRPRVGPARRATRGPSSGAGCSSACS